MDMATANQVTDLLRRIGDTSSRRFGRLLDNWKVLKQIADGRVSPTELRRLTEERFVPLSDYGIDVDSLNWRDFRQQLSAYDITWSQLCTVEPDGTYNPFRSVDSPESLGELADFFGQSPDKWRIRLAAY